TQQVSPLRPNEQLRPATPGGMQPGTDSAGNMLGPPTLAGLSGGRGRAQLLSRGRNSAPPMIGDFFGAGPGNESIILGPIVESVATANSQSVFSGYTINGTSVSSNGTLFGVPGSALTAAPGAAFGPSGELLSVTGLSLVDASGTPITGTGANNTFTALATGGTLTGLNPITGAFTIDRDSPVYGVHPELRILLPNP